jgi:hypothetical protein
MSQTAEIAALRAALRNVLGFIHEAVLNGLLDAEEIAHADEMVEARVLAGGITADPDAYHAQLKAALAILAQREAETLARDAAQA